MAKNQKWEIIAHEYVVSLFPVFMLVDGIYRKGVEMAEVITDHATTHCYLAQGWQAAHRRVVAKVRKNPDYLRRIFHFIDVEGKKLAAFARRFAGKDLKKISNFELNRCYQNYCRQNIIYYGYGVTTVLLDFQKTTFLSDEVNKFLAAKKAVKYFSLLTTPLQDTFNKKHELELLEILKSIKAKKKILDLFKKNDSQGIVKALPAADKVCWQKIRRHTKKYAWVHYVYEGPAADEAYFIDILRDFVKRGVDPKKEIAGQRAEKFVLRQKQARILADLQPNKYQRQIILLARDLVYFKIYRRDLQTMSYYCMADFVLAEIGRRLGLSLKQVRMMLPREIAAALLKGRLDVAAINRRFKLVVYARVGGRQRLLTGKPAAAFAKNIKTEKVKTNLKEIKGTTAFPGKAKGIARLVNSPEDMAKMRPGDILISAATNPNIMPAIRQAAAIATDEGGLTCHAAIVSREFKIPCVVGTGFVTQVIKDGDLVEVDATNGIVKKI